MKRNLSLFLLWLSVMLAAIVATLGNNPYWILLPFLAAWLSLYLITWPRPIEGISQYRLDKRRLYHRSGILWAAMVQILFGGFFQSSLLAWYIEIGILVFLFWSTSRALFSHQTHRFAIGLSVGLPLGTIIAQPLMSAFVALLAGTGSKDLVAADFFPALVALAGASTIITQAACSNRLKFDINLSQR